MFLVSVVTNTIGTSPVAASMRHAVAAALFEGKIMQTIDNLEIMQELALIIRGAHPAWRGDKRYNAGFFLRQIKNDFNGAAALARDIRENLEYFEQEINLPSRTLLQAANVLAGDSIDL